MAKGPRKILPTAVNFESLAALGDDLDAFASDVKKAILRSGGNAASEVFQNEAKRFAPVSKPRGASRFVGPLRANTQRRRNAAPGLLRDSIYRAYSEENSDEDTATYVVSWNKAKAFYGIMMEYGSVRHPAHPFMRPAWDSGKAKAGEAALERMARRMASLQRGGA